MSKKVNFDTIFSNAGKAAKNLMESAVQIADQTDDGKFDMEDVSVIAETVGAAVKKGSKAVKEGTEEKLRQIEEKLLQPIFADSLNEADFLMSKFIRVTEREKKYIDSEVCQGSIGYMSNQKGLYYVNIFRDSIDAFGVSLYPDSDYDFYYADPSERDRYIALDEYFGYLKIARVNELQKIAQDLGAKHFKVTYKEEKTSFSERKAKAKANMKTVATAEASHDHSEKQYSTVEVAAENSFPGHAPKKPELKYLQRDASIQTLVEMRMDESSPLEHQKYMLKLSNSSGIKENDAAKIDAVLDGLKCSGNATVASEAKNEFRRYLEYEIDF